jgi:hypothetical protein
MDRWIEWFVSDQVGLRVFLGLALVLALVIGLALGSSITVLFTIKPIRRKLRCLEKKIEEIRQGQEAVEQEARILGVGTALKGVLLPSEYPGRELMSRTELGRPVLDYFGNLWNMVQRIAEEGRQPEPNWLVEPTKRATELFPSKQSGIRQYFRELDQTVQQVIREKRTLPADWLEPFVDLVTEDDV